MGRNGLGSICSTEFYKIYFVKKKTLILKYQLFNGSLSKSNYTRSENNVYAYDP